MLKRLRWKFITVIMSIVTVMLVLLFVGINLTTRNELKNQSFRQMEALAERPQPSDPHLQEEHEPKLSYFAVQKSSDGTYTATGSSSYDLTDEAFLAALTDAAAASGEKNGQLEEYSLRFCLTHTPDGERFIFTDYSNERTMLRSLAFYSAVIELAVLLFMFGLSLLLSRWVVRPVETAWQQQRQFVADASHELKTPLTVIQTCGELLQAPDTAPEEQQRCSESILSMATQMRKLVERMLELARADNGQVKVVLEKLDFSALVNETLLPYEPLFFERDLMLESDIADGIAVHGCAQQLEQVLEVLLDNAGKYAAAPGTVTVSLARAEHGHCRLSVTTPGAPLSAEACKNIFRRFYRVDTARSRDGSFGLGLSIAQSYVNNHHGKIWAEGSTEGNRFLVELPTV